MNAYEQEHLIKRAPQGLLMAVMQGKSDDFPQWMALAELNSRKKMGVANDGMKAQQQLAQGQQTVKDRKLAELLPEMQGIGQLPAPNMEALAAAHGGLMSYAHGGEVESYAEQGLVLPEGYEMFEDPTSGEVYPRKKVGFLQAYGQRLQNQAQGIKPAAPVVPAAPVAAPAAASAAKTITEAPKSVKSAAVNVTQPTVPVDNPTKEQKSNMQRMIDDSKVLEDYMSEKFGKSLDPIKDQLSKDREEYKNMKSENVGLALLGAAGALLKPGRSTASAIGEGLGTLAEYGAKFQPQMLAARQGISAGEVGLAQAQAQAARGNFSTAMQAVGQEENRALAERELAAKEKLYGAQAGYYGARAGATGGGGPGAGLAAIKQQQSLIQAELKSLQGRVDPASQDRVRVLQQQLAQLSQAMSGKTGLDLTTGFVGGKDVSGKTYRSSLFEE